MDEIEQEYIDEVSKYVDVAKKYYELRVRINAARKILEDNDTIENRGNLKTLEQEEIKLGLESYDLRHKIRDIVVNSSNRVPMLVHLFSLGCKNMYLSNIFGEFYNNTSVEFNLDVLEALSIHKFYPDDIADKSTLDTIITIRGLMKNTTDAYHNILDMYYEHLKEFPEERLKELHKEMDKRILKDLPKMYKTLSASKIDTYSLATDLLTNDDIDVEDRAKLFNTLIENNPFFSSFDRKNLIKKNPYTLVCFKNMLKYADDKIIDNFIDSLAYGVESDDPEEIMDDLETIFDMLNYNNKDESKYLKSFYEYFDSKRNDYKKLFECLDNVKSYNSIQREKFDIDDTINKLLEGNEVSLSNNEINLLIDSDLFKDNFKNLLDKFINSNNIEYKKSLILPLILYESNVIKDKKNLEYNVTFEDSRENNKTLGYYNEETKELFINKNYIVNNASNEILVIFMNTLFHETTHAKQWQHDLKKDEPDFEIVNFIMDKELSSKFLSEYYNDNYYNISYEVDARTKAYVESCTFFKDYPELLDIAEKTCKYPYDAREGELKVSDLTKCYSTSLGCFMDEVFFDESELDKYPALKYFFNFEKLELKNGDYFYKVKNKSKEELEELINLETDPVRKAKYIESAKVLNHLVDVNNYLKTELFTKSTDKKEVVEKVEENVGRSK